MSDSSYSMTSTTIEKLFSMFMFVIFIGFARAHKCQLADDLLPCVLQLNSELSNHCMDWEKVDQLIMKGKIISANYSDFINKHLNIDKFPGFYD